MPVPKLVARHNHLIPFFFFKECKLLSIIIKIVLNGRHSYRKLMNIKYVMPKTLRNVFLINNNDAKYISSMTFLNMFRRFKIM